MARKNQTYSLDAELIKKVDNYAATNTGNKSKVIELALEKFFKEDDKR